METIVAEGARNIADGQKILTVSRHFAQHVCFSCASRRNTYDRGDISGDAQPK